VFVLFFVTLSVEMDLGWGTKGAFCRKEDNDDYRRQQKVVDRVIAHPAWQQSGGRDHVFVLIGNSVQMSLRRVKLLSGAAAVSS
jgi:hypothetical protein